MREFLSFHPLGQWLTVSLTLALLLTAMAALDRICLIPFSG